MDVTRRVRSSLTMGFVFVFAYLAFALFSNPTLIGGQAAANRETTRSSIVSNVANHQLFQVMQEVPVGTAAFRTVPKFVPKPEPEIKNRTTPSAKAKRPIHKSMKRVVTHSPAVTVHIASGDCLWNIAAAYHTTVNHLEDINHLSSSTLQIGQVLTVVPSKTDVHWVPSSRASHHRATANVKRKHTTAAHARQVLIYTVKPGDSLWSIAQMYGVSIDTIRSVNAIGGDAIFPGAKLKICAVNTTYHPTAASKALISKAPKWLIPVYKAAGRKYDVPWTVLVAIHKEETDFGVTGNDISYAGAIGPMQFMPDTFRIFGVAAPGHTTPDIHNVEDAIYSAANMLHQEGIQADPYYAIFRYNHSSSYVHDILHMSAM